MNRLGLYAIGAALGLALALGVGWAVMNAQPAYNGVLIDPPAPAADFTLTDQNGQEYTLADRRGRAVLVFFGYTNCPDVCPGTLAEFVRVKRELGVRADDVAFVLVSVDGRRDTPEVIADYLAQFDADFVGLTGSEDELRALGAEYGLIFESTAAAAEQDHSTHESDHDHDKAHGSHAHGEDVQSDHYFVNHTSPSFLIDPDGYLRLLYFVGTRGDAMAAGVEQILMERGA